MTDPDNMNGKFSIKNILFYRAIPNYEIPIPIDGHKVYACTDCCDRFLLESSYERHINRKSMKITYMCRHCNDAKIFLNRCNLLSHIRSHAFKTATINVSDLKVEPIPLSFYKYSVSTTPNRSESQQSLKDSSTTWMCFDCKVEFSCNGPIYKERANHYMKLSSEVYTCPVCLFAMPNSCGLKAHLRLHTNSPPFYCPECGMHMATKSIKYPYTHHCEGFKMMRATSRLQCPIANCKLVHPNDVNQHLRKKHVVKVYKCNACVVASYSNHTMVKHLKMHNIECKALIFYQCVLCPGRLVLPGQIDHHLKSHIDSQSFTNVFPCWNCSHPSKDITAFLNHHVEKHCNNERIKRIIESAASPTANTSSKRIYRVVKRCDKCLRSFTYKCKYDQIQVLPDECPYKCAAEPLTNSLPTKISSPIPLSPSPPGTTQTEKKIKCPSCKTYIIEEWEEIKQHFSEHHKNQRCLDINVTVKKIDLNRNKKQYKIVKRKRSRKTRKNSNDGNQMKGKCTSEKPATSLKSKKNQFECYICDYAGKDKESFESHIIKHKDPCMAYQCMECGKCFVVKPSFSTHMLLEHDVSDVDEYIAQKQCYNENALDKYQNDSNDAEPLRENQCRICRDQFDCTDDLEKHFRVHGMAFLLKKTTNKSP